MTIAELNRAIQSKNRVNKAQAKEKAALDYILANLIGVNVMRGFSKSVDVPTIEEAYSFLFEEERVKKQLDKQKEIDELSTLRFKQFAKSYNNRFK